MARIFLSYASEQRRLAASIEAALSAEDHQVFFDKTRLPSGEAYHRKIVEAIRNSQLFIFLISPDSIKKGTYALTELKEAKRKWPNPSGKVIPVQLLPTDPTAIDPYLLQGVTILRPEGSVTAETVNRVREMTGGDSAERMGELTVPVLDGRIEAYRTLWALTDVLPKWPRAKGVRYQRLQEFSGQLREWYFANAGGMFLTRLAHNRYSALQDALTALTDRHAKGVVKEKHYEAIRELCSSLRTQLARDLGTRT